MPRGRGGGFKQRLERQKLDQQPGQASAVASTHPHQAEENLQAPKDQLAKLLIAKWAWGHMSTPTLQALALAAREDEAKGRLLRFLAKLGGSGQRPGNMHRDIVACLRKRARRLHIIPRPLRVVLKLGWEWRLMDTSIIYPHELFASLCEHRPKAWQEIMLGGGEQELSKFWADVGPYPHMVGRPDYRTKCIPLMVHGDGVALVQAGRAGGRGVDVLSWGSIMARKHQTRVTTFLVYLVFSHLTKKTGWAQTWSKVWRHIAWSLQAIFRGLWPDRSPEGLAWPPGSPEEKVAGTPLAQGYWGTLVACRGDLEWMQKHHHLQSSTSRDPCNLCQCTNTGQDAVPWTDCNLAAAWIPTSWQDEEWLRWRREEGKVVHPCLDPAMTPGGRISLWRPDWMHIKHLGTDQYLLGSIISWIIHRMGC